MKKHISYIILITLTLILFLMDCTPIFASSSDLDMAKSYAKHNYPQCKIVVVNHYNAQRIEHRKGKKVVYIEKFISYSKGKYGYSKDGYYVSYNTKVKKGKRVVSYFIYNPYTNYCDDVVAVVDNHRIR